MRVHLRRPHRLPVIAGLAALVVAGSDWSVVPSANPWIGIESLVTRRAPGGAGAAGTDVHMVQVLRTLIGGETAYERGKQSTAAALPQVDDWLMIVKTQNLDPSAETAFNRWYDDVDIPDVLQVPGYTRARRGARIATYRPTLRETDAGETYVAAYDIRSPDIDKTIIDMLMASWRMDQLGRSTKLIKVVERVYYHTYTPPVTGSARVAGERYLYLQRFDCCSSSADRQRFDRWYHDSYLARLADAEAFTRAKRYELYRVLMHEPREAPGFLTLFEITADSADEALRHATRIDAALASMPEGLGASRARDSGLYQVIKDAP